MSAPFSVRQSSLAGEWCLYRQIDTPGDAIDYAYRNWPWWP